MKKFENGIFFVASYSIVCCQSFVVRKVEERDFYVMIYMIWFDFCLKTRRKFSMFSWLYWETEPMVFFYMEYIFDIIAQIAK